jgi:hypothetical protein
MGDLGFLQTVEAMAQTTPPVLTIEPGESPFPRTATITEKVLAGKLDYITLNPAER